MNDTSEPRAQLRDDLSALRIERDAAPARVARRRRFPWRLMVLTLIVIGAVAAWWTKSHRPLEVNVAQAKLASPQDIGPAPVLSGSGYVVTGERYVSIGVRVPGRIDRYFVEEGQSVRQDDPLVQLDDRDYRAIVARTQAGIEMANANLGLADAELRRGRLLRTQNVISQQELDVLENKSAVMRATLGQLQAELVQARVNLDYTTLRSPTNGVILAKLKEVGEIAVPGGFAGSGDLIRIADLSDMRAEVDVNEADLKRVRLRQPARVTPDAYPGAEYPAEVIKLYPQVDRQKGTLKIEVKILRPDEKLLPDMSARVTFLEEPGAGGSKPVVLVPSAALQRDTRGDTFVWVVDGSRARRAQIETAGEVGDLVRVAKGLTGGEQIVVGEGPEREGQSVVVRQTATAG